MVDPITAMGAMKGAYETIKSGLTIADRLGDVELKEIILSLKQSILEKDEQILFLKENLADAQRKQKQKENLTYERNVYWLVEGENKDGPYCPGCYGDKEKLVRMTIGEEYWNCPVCKHLEQHTKSNPIRMSRARRDEGWDSI
ncbi:MAG: hypothetical protein DI551_03355 [Micavibrio aeruginosavorus]|uniref:Uncharacterized protein n=1 Tax=Micavibrio aeruginosavorus TaxID=349221 RepID=A0A2W5PY57_9BACT|nr:MAG: hypothetical protein DI551_03355 [Micavibrio aeruginosavorus]